MFRSEQFEISKIKWKKMNLRKLLKMILGPKSGDQIVFPQDESNQKKLTYTLFCQSNDQSQKTLNMDNGR